MTRIIIAGSRYFKNYDLLKKEVLRFIKDFENVEIVSGGQVTTDADTGDKFGADYLGERFAKENELKLTIFPAEWGKYGKSAGPRRNYDMAIYAHMSLCFWDGKSKGTKNMIELSKKHCQRTEVVY